MAVSFEITKKDRALILKIVDRIMARDKTNYLGLERCSVSMDITAAHANGCPMDLARWLGAVNFEFDHDAFGIMEHLDRETGELTDCFLPRYAAKENGK